jgi:MarR family transcriptional regulator, organic hydroperoxide resistance regulator
MGTDVDRSAQRYASSPEGLRRLIQSVCRANGDAWESAGRTAELVSNDIAALSSVVDEKQMTGVELREASGLTSSSVTELADRLERARLITRVRGNHDRRLVVIKPTAKGQRTVNRALGPLHARLSEVQKRHDAEELERLAELLVEINDALVEAGGDGSNPSRR